LTSGYFTKPTIVIAREKLGDDSDLAGLLLNKNIDLVRVDSGSDAVSVFHINPTVALAVINADLYGLNGFITALEIRKLSPTVPIILLINYLNTVSIRLSILVGCTRILQSPVHPHDMDTIVEQYLIGQGVFSTLTNK
jgi:DNA-binding NarL/FixJ family response regulator